MCAPYYVEFPVDNVIDVHWKKKDDKPPDDHPPDSPPCGGFYNKYGGYAYGIIITDSEVFDLFHPPPPPGQPTESNPRWYLWNTPEGGFTVEIHPQITYGYGLFAQNPELPEGMRACNEYSIEIGLHLIRNMDPHVVAQTPINDYPAGVQGVIQFQGWQKNESWWPIVLVVGKAIDTELPGTGPCIGKGANVIAPILIQAHCAHETYGGPPPQEGLPPGLIYAWG